MDPDQKNEVPTPVQREPRFKRRDFLKATAAAAAAAAIPGLRIPDRKTDPELEEGLKELQKQLTYPKENFHLDFSVPYYHKQGVIQEAGGNFIFDLNLDNDLDPIEYLASLAWSEKPIPLDSLQSEALNHVSGITIVLTPVDLTPNSQSEREYLEQLARAFPRLALGLPPKVDFVSTRMVRRERAEEDRLTLLNPTTTERTTTATLLATLHEADHYFEAPRNWQELSPYFTLQEFALLQANHLKATNEIFSQLTATDIDNNPEVLDVYFISPYTEPTMNSIAGILTDRSTSLEDVARKLGIELPESPPHVQLVKVIQTIEKSYSEQPEEMKEVYQALAGRVYYDIFHTFVDFAPTNEYKDPFAVDDPEIYLEADIDQQIENPFLKWHADLAVLRMEVLAGRKVNTYDEVVDYLEAEASKIPS